MRFWAAARQAAGHTDEQTQAVTVGELRAQLSARAKLAEVVGVSSFLVDGTQAGDCTPIGPGSIVDVLPPFAGG